MTWDDREKRRVIYGELSGADIEYYIPVAPTNDLRLNISKKKKWIIMAEMAQQCSEHYNDQSWPCLTLTPTQLCMVSRYPQIPINVHRMHKHVLETKKTHPHATDSKTRQFRSSNFYIFRTFCMEGFTRTEHLLSRACCVGAVLYPPIAQFL